MCYLKELSRSSFSAATEYDTYSCPHFLHLQFTPRPPTRLSLPVVFSLIASTLHVSLHLEHLSLIDGVDRMIKDNKSVEEERRSARSRGMPPSGVPHLGVLRRKNDRSDIGSGSWKGVTRAPLPTVFSLLPFATTHRKGSRSDWVFIPRFESYCFLQVFTFEKRGRTWRAMELRLTPPFRISFLDIISHSCISVSGPEPMHSWFEGLNSSLLLRF